MILPIGRGGPILMYLMVSPLWNIQIDNILLGLTTFICDKLYESPVYCDTIKTYLFFVCSLQTTCAFVKTLAVLNPLTIYPGKRLCNSKCRFTLLYRIFLTPIYRAYFILFVKNHYFLIPKLYLAFIFGGKISFFKSVGIYKFRCFCFKFYLKVFPRNFNNNTFLIFYMTNFLI